MRKLFALGLGAVLALAADGTGVAQDDPSSVRVQVRVWQHVENGQNIHVSARPEGGLWRTFGTRRLRLDDGFDDTDTFRYGDIALDVPLWNWVGLAGDRRGGRLAARAERPQRPHQCARVEGLVGVV